jgi:hypothetical protein
LPSWRWSDEDGNLVIDALRDAAEHPVKRKLPKSAFRKPPQVIETEHGPITVPDDDEDLEQITTGAGSEHSHMQWLLVKMGAAMGYDVFVATGDRSREWEGERLGDLPHVIDELRIPLLPEAKRIIERIDVLWLDRDAVQAAFEVERTTSIFSGILRMTDLLALQPNLDIPIFLVAPDDRRDRVIEQVNRPTFARMRKPLSSVCRYISFGSLQELEALGDKYWPHMKFSYVAEELAEIVDTESV